MVGLVDRASGHLGGDVGYCWYGWLTVRSNECKQTGETLALIASVAHELDGGAVRWRHDGRYDVTGRKVPAVACYDWRRRLGDAVTYHDVVGAVRTAVAHPAHFISEYTSQASPSNLHTTHGHVTVYSHAQHSWSKSAFSWPNLTISSRISGWQLSRVGVEPPQFMSKDAHFWVKIGFKFQSLGKISNILTSDPQFF